MTINEWAVKTFNAAMPPPGLEVESHTEPILKEGDLVTADADGWREPQRIGKIASSHDMSTCRIYRCVACTALGKKF